MSTPTTEQWMVLWLSAGIILAGLFLSTRGRP